MCGRNRVILLTMRIATAEGFRFRFSAHYLCVLTAGFLFDGVGCVYGRCMCDSVPVISVFLSIAGSLFGGIESVVFSEV